MQMALKNLDSEIFWSPTQKMFGGWICYKDSPAPPPAPDPKATADAQTSSNLATAQKNAELNRVNQYTPYGNLTYSQNKSPDTFDQAGYDAAMQKYQSGLNPPQQPQYLSEAVGGGDGGDQPARINPSYQANQSNQLTAPNRNDFIRKGDSDTWNSTISKNYLIQAIKLVNQWQILVSSKSAAFKKHSAIKLITVSCQASLIIPCSRMFLLMECLIM